MQKFFFNKSYVLIFISLTALFLSACSSSPENASENFKETVDERDPEALLELVTVDEGTYWTEQQAQQVVEFFHDDSEKYQEQLQLLEQQVTALDEGNMVPREEGLFYFDDEGELRVRNYEVAITNEASDLDPEQLTITIDEEDAIEIENLDESIGLFGPGDYSFVAEGEFPYATIESEGSFSLMNTNSFNQSVDLDLEESIVNISSSIDNTKLLVNGEETGTEIASDEQETSTDITGDGQGTSVSFGPISEENTLQGVAEFPWGEAQSEEFTVDEETEYDITPGVLTSEENRDAVTEQINNYYETHMAALVNLDIDELTDDVSDDLRESLNDTLKSATNSSIDTSYEGEILGTRIDFGQTSYELGSGGRHYVTLPVEIHREYTENNQYRDDDPEEEYLDKSLTLEYLEDEEKWIVSEEGEDYSITGNDDTMAGDDVVETEL
ncbi:TcaA 3rd/4th domain-containing protein [Oceanobacillus timonensis]|uniref:TcaA 3rd/4th domain-containing protein n=1 Tax=Oceanobacillus timonensis TaxID=1926285 RepID=UPI0009BA9D24|nr:hypothetical protein [Oceanobacillus timonensis]